MQAFYGFPQRGSGAALNLCCVRMKSHSRWCLNTSSTPQPAENPSLLAHKWEIKISTCCASSRDGMEGAVGPPCPLPATHLLQGHLQRLLWSLLPCSTSLLCLWKR